MSKSVKRVATAVATGGLSETVNAAQKGASKLGGLTKSGGNEAITPGKVNKITTEEQTLLTLMMEMFKNPQATPSAIIDNYLNTMGESENFYKAFPDYANKRLAEASNNYASEIAKIQATPGTGISFDGKPITTVFPLKTMGVQAGLSTDKYNAQHDTITDALTQELATREALNKIAADKYSAVINPAMNIWNSMYQGRFGGSVGTTAYEPSWAEKLLTAMSGSGAAGKGGAITAALGG